MPRNSLLPLLLVLLLQLLQLLTMQEKQHSTAATAISGLFSLSCLALGAPIAAAIAAGAATINAANSRDEEEVVRRGAAAYNQLLRESVEEGAASGCWQQVSEQLLLLQQQTIEDACSSKGEPFRELIALTRMRCIYIRSGRLFPGPAEGCYLFPHEVPASWMRPCLLCLVAVLCVFLPFSCVTIFYYYDHLVLLGKVVLL